MRQLFFALLLLFGCVGAVSATEDYTTELKELEKQVEKQALKVGGFLEYQPFLFGVDKNASLYKLQYGDKHLGSTLLQNTGTVRLEGSYEKGITSFFLVTNSTYSTSSVDSGGQTLVYTGYVSVKPSASLTLDFGKRTFKWGKGYAWNPAAFIDRPKNPEDPELALEGFVAASADYIRSFSGPLKTFSFTPVLLPQYGSVNNDFGETGHVNLAARAYFLLYDTDVDLMFLTGGSRTPRYGIDFSRNIGTNLEIHGEGALINHSVQPVVDPNGKVVRRSYRAVNYLLGLRYLTARDTTYILEYYYQGSGFSPRQVSNFFSVIDRGYEMATTMADNRLLKKAATLSEAGYSRFTPETHYLYLRASQKEPFDILYFTPAITWIYNMGDRSFLIMPELLYAPLTNLELRLRTGLLVAGMRNSEFGEKPYDYRVEFRMRYYF